MATKLGKYVNERGGKLIGGPHEGLVLQRPTVSRILRFLDKHPDIATDLFEFENAVAEFALHTLAAFLGGEFALLQARNGWAQGKPHADSPMKKWIKTHALAERGWDYGYGGVK